MSPLRLARNSFPGRDCCSVIRLAVGAVAVTLALPVAEALHGQRPETASVRLRVETLGTVDGRFPAEIRVDFLEAATGTPLVSVSAEAGDAEASDLRAEVPVPAVGRFWEVAATADGWWGPSSLVGTEQSELDLILVPAGLVRLELIRAERGIDLARGVAIAGGISRGSQAKGAFLDPGIYRGRCRVESDPEEVVAAVLCPFALGPVAALEVTLGPFVPFRQSDVSVGADVTPTMVEPVRGASVAGTFLDDAGGEANRFVLRRVDASQFFSRSSWADSLGFFEFGGLHPGEYELGRIGASETWTVSIESLRDVVDLGGLHSSAETRLVVSLGEPFPVEAGDLTLELNSVARSENGNVYRRGLPLKPTSHASGEWTWSGIPAGSYEVQVGDHAGNRLGGQPIEFRGYDRVFVELDAIPLAGKIRRGDEPLEDVTIWFGGVSGQSQQALGDRDSSIVKRVAMRSTEGGSFEGWLPLSGSRWYVEVSPSPECDPCEGGWDRVASDLDSVTKVGSLEIEAGSDGVARVEIELPEGGFEGQVFRAGPANEAPERVSGARIIVVPHESKTGPVWRAKSNAEGEYRVTGVPEGVYRIQAAVTLGGRELRTRSVTATVGKSLTSVELRLEEQQRVTVSVRSFVGVPVASAHVLARPVGASEVVGVGVTRLDGIAEFWLPSESRAMDVVVRKRGMGMVAWRFDLNQGPIQVELQELRGSLRVPFTSSGSIVSPGGVQWDTDSLRGINGSWHIRVEGDEYVVSELAPGRWTYCLSAGICTAVEVTPWSENRLFR